MTVTVSLAPDEEQKLARLAAASGVNPSEYVQQLIKKELDAPLSLLEAAEPFARAVDSSGIGDFSPRLPARNCCARCAENQNSSLTFRSPFPSLATPMMVARSA